MTFTTDAYAGDVFTGTVSEVRLQPVVTQNVVTYTTIITVPNPGAKLKPGMTATVQIESGADSRHTAGSGRGHCGSGRRRSAAGVRRRCRRRRSRARVAAEVREIPDGATASDRAVVWQVVNGTLKPVRVTVGISDGTTVAVTSDSAPGGDAGGDVAEDRRPGLGVEERSRARRR